MKHSIISNIVTAISYHLFGPLIYLAMAAAIPLTTYETIKKKRIRLVEKLLFSHLTAYTLGVSLIFYHSVRLGKLFLSGKFLDNVTGSLSGKIVIYLIGYWT